MAELHNPRLPMFSALRLGARTFTALRYVAAAAARILPHDISPPTSAHISIKFSQASVGSKVYQILDNDDDGRIGSLLNSLDGGKKDIV